MVTYNINITGSNEYFCSVNLELQMCLDSQIFINITLHVCNKVLKIPQVCEFDILFIGKIIYKYIIAISPI